MVAKHMTIIFATGCKIHSASTVFHFCPRWELESFHKSSRGTLVEKCCHFFALMRLIIKSDPVRFMASADQEVNHLGENYDGQNLISEIASM